MDEVESAIVSVSGQIAVGADAERWFRALCSAYDDFGENWSLFKDALTTRAYEALKSAAVAEEFLSFMDAEVGDKTGVLKAMRNRGDDLPRVYAALVNEEKAALTTLAEPAEPAEPADPVESWDDATAADWYHYLTAQSGWDGWRPGVDFDEFAAYFLHLAEQSQVKAQAADLVERLRPDPAAALSRLGIEGAAAEATAGPTWGEQAAAWYEHLTKGKHWAGWSGADAEWEEFTKWFRHYADQEGVPAEAEDFLGRIEASADKVSAFAALGITIGQEAAAPVEDTWGNWSPAEWYDYLTSLPRDPCPKWNGMAGDHWDYFKYWFVTKAVAEGGLGAQAFIDEIDAADDKVVALRRHGITILDPNGIPVPPKPPAVKAAPERPPLEQAEEIVARAVAKLREEHPEFAGISQEKLKEFAISALSESVLAH